MGEKDENKLISALRAEVIRQIAEREQYRIYLAEQNAWKKRQLTINKLKKATGAS